MSAASYDGSCFCGRVRYRFSGAVKFVAHDQCSICRRFFRSKNWPGEAHLTLATVAGVDLI
jgi:hypothetical protein